MSFTSKQLYDCQKKHVFECKRDAEESAFARNIIMGVKLFSYRCPICDLWHLSRSRDEGSKLDNWMGK